MKEIINSLWIGRPLSPIERLSITSFLRNGLEYRLHCYEEIKNIPAGTILCDASKILPASEIFYYQCKEGRGSVAAFSNLFRYKLLAEQGGWWADTDVVCLKPFDFKEPLIIASERTPDGVEKVANAVMKLPAGHPVAIHCYEGARREDPAKLAWGETGPQLLGRIVRESGLERLVKPPEIFCPLDYWDWPKVLEKDGRAENLFTSESYTVHLWHELWRRAGIKVNATTGALRPPNVAAKLRLWRDKKARLDFGGLTPFAELLYSCGIEESNQWW